jgi:hypothetical protein
MRELGYLSDVPAQHVRGVSRANYVRELLGELVRRDRVDEPEPRWPGYLRR